jgi:hypothetical protein
MDNSHEETPRAAEKHIERSQASEPDCLPGGLGQVSAVGEKAGDNPVRASGNDCIPAGDLEQGGAKIVGGVVRQLVANNQALMQMLTTQNELLSQIVASLDPDGED